MARLPEEDVYRLDVENSLEEFILSYAHTLPQRVKVTEGYYNEGSDCEFSAGDVLVLQRVVCPTVTLSYCDPSSGIDYKTSVPVNHPVKFHSEPYLGVQAHAQKDVIYTTVKELVEKWPVVVKTTKEFTKSGTLIFAAKERLTLIRMVTKHGLSFLECKHHKSQKVIQLPMGCEGGFVALKDRKLYTLDDIVFNQPPRQRLLRIAEDVRSLGSVPLTGVPVDFKGDLFMQAPGLMVELFPCDSPGDVVAVPITTPIVVSPREDTYTGSVRMEYPLAYYIEKNPGHMPGLITVTSWEEMTTICDNIGVRPGVKVHLYRLENVPKVIARTSTRFFAIPLTYGRNLNIEPPEYENIVEVYYVPRPIKVKVTKASSAVPYAKLHAVKEGEVLRLVKGSQRPCQVGPTRSDEIEIFSVEVLDPVNYRVMKTILVPSYLDGTYTEVLEPDQKDLRRLGRIGIMDFPVQVQFTDSGDPVVDPTLDPIPTHSNMVLTHIIDEPCVVASKKVKYARSFHLPLRTELMLTFEDKLSPRVKQPTLSVLDTFGEEISEAVYDKLKTYESNDHGTYDMVKEPAPSRPLPCPLHKTTSWKERRAEVPKPPKIPPATSPKPLTRSTSSPHDSRLDAQGYVKPIGFKYAAEQVASPESRQDQGVYHQVVQTPTASEVEDMYEVVTDYAQLSEDLYSGTTPPIVEIPQDGNVSMFTHYEMLVFLQLLSVPTTAAIEFSKTKITGKDFALFSNDDLERYHLRTALTIHFRDRSRKALSLL